MMHEPIGMTCNEGKTSRSHRNHGGQQIPILLGIASFQGRMDLNIIRNEQVIDIRINHPSIHEPVNLVGETRHDDYCKIIGDPLLRKGDNGSWSCSDGHVFDDAFCPGRLVVEFLVISDTFLDRCHDIVVVGAEGIDGTFKGKGGAHGSQRSSEGGDDRTSVKTASEDTCRQEGVVVGFLVGRERSLFIFLDEYSLDVGKRFGFPVKVCDNGVDFVDEIVRIAPDTIDDILGSIVVKLSSANGRFGGCT
jgi:hypothetical protein